MKASINKYYDYKQSPFYRIGTKKKLAQVLNVSDKQLSLLQESGSVDLNKSKYYLKDVMTVGKPSRPAQVPFGLKRQAHQRIKELLCRIETQPYLMSSKKGSFILKNAEKHLDSKYMKKMDIAKFYPSCKQYHVYNFFFEKMEMSKDVAYAISKICVFEDFLPTGSPLSQILAYFINQDVFDDIQNVAFKNECIFTLWVDDIVLSSKVKIPTSVILEIKKKLWMKGLDTKKKKDKSYLPEDHKLVTGVIITKDNKIDVNNSARQKIHLMLEVKNLEDFSELELKKLHGILSQGRQIQKDFMTKLYVQTFKRLKAMNLSKPKKSK